MFLRASCPGLNVEIPVERLYAAFEACPVVLRTKRLDAQRVLGSAPHFDEIVSLKECNDPSGTATISQPSIRQVPSAHR